MLFGSVARGEADESSDIDLVAIYDDLDYSDRFDRKLELSRLVKAEIGYPVDVIVRDRPEWKMRTERVPTSFESRVDRYGLVLADQGVNGKVDWDKEMVLPTDGYGATIRRLREVISALRSLRLYLEPDDDEREARDTGDYEEALYLEIIRYEGACGQVHRAVESALKALIHVAGRRREIRGHDVEYLAARLVEPYRGEVSAMLSVVGARELTRWHEASRYTSDDPEYEPPEAEIIRRMATLACGIALYAIDQLDENDLEVSRVRKAVNSVSSQLDGYDLKTGDPRP